MSRRYRPLLLLLMLTAAGLWFALPWLWRQTTATWQELRLRKTALNEQSVASLAYPLPAERWLEFTIPPATPRLKIIVNANIPPEAADPPGQRWQYTLRYQVVDASGQVLREQVYHHETGLTRYRAPDGTLYSGAAYLENAAIPADGRYIRLDLRGIHLSAARLRLRLESYQAPVDGAVARVYAPAKVAEFRLGALWQRLTPDVKAQMARGNLYPPHLLDENEKLNLLRNQWEALGPLGVRERDYRITALYVRREIEDERHDIDLPPGLALDANHDGILGIPEGGGRLRLSLYQAQPSRLPQPVPIRLEWFGRGLNQRWTQTLNWDGLSDPLLEQTVDGGLLRIQAPLPLAARALLQQTEGGSTVMAREPQQTINATRAMTVPLTPTLSQGERENNVAAAFLSIIDITPPPTYLKTYLADPARAVSYPVLHAGSLATPLRLDLRTLTSDGVATGARLTLLDAAGRSLSEQTLPVAAVPARLERLAGPLEQPPLADPVSYFFHLPAEVAALRIDAERPLLVSAFNQAPGASKFSRVPEDAYTSLHDIHWNPGWFVMVPDAAEQMASDNRLRILQTQPRPSEDDPLLAQGRYRWRDYLPEGAWQGEYLLTSRAPGEALRTEALSSAYCALPLNRAAVVTIKGVGLQQLTPDLLFTRDAGSPFRLTVSVDGKPLLQSEHAGRRGVLTLPPITAGRHRLQITSTATGGTAPRFWLNQVADCPGDIVLKRRAFRLDAPLEIIVDKPGVEAIGLTGYYYSPAGSTARVQLDVALSGPLPPPSRQPRPGWTFPRRSYDIRPAQGHPSALLFNGGRMLDQGQMFSIPLDSDLPPGRYRLHITRSDGPAGYLSLSSLEPGVFAQRRIYREELADAP